MVSQLLNEHRDYTLLVAGDVDLSKYDMSRQVEKHVCLRLADGEKMRQQFIAYYRSMYEQYQDPIHSYLLESIKSRIEELENSTGEDVFWEETYDLEHDPITGDALTTANPDGKWRVLKDPDPYITMYLYEHVTPKGDLNGGTFECYKKDVIPFLPNEDDVEKLSRVWEIKVEGKSPKTKDEKEFVKKSKTTARQFIDTYGTKERYIKTLLSGLVYHAFVSEETGWVEQSESEDQIQWMIDFYDRFIKDLPDDTKLKVYNFSR